MKNTTHSSNIHYLGESATVTYISVVLFVYISRVLFTDSFEKKSKNELKISFSEIQGYGS